MRPTAPNWVWSADHYGRLAGVSGLSIYKWESGKAAPRGAGRSALTAIRGLGKREALRRLTELGITPGAKSGRRQLKAPAAKKSARRQRA